MASKVFEKFKQTSIANNTFSRLFYENIQVSNTNPPIYYLKIHKDMCDASKTADQSSIISALDGLTAIALLSKFSLSGFSASININTHLFSDIYEEDVLSIIPRVLKFDPLTRIGQVSGAAYKDSTLVADCLHTMMFLGVLDEKAARN